MPCLRLHRSQVEEPGCFTHPLFSKYLSTVDCKPGPVPDTGDLEMPKILPVSSRSPQHGLPDHLGPRHICWIPVALTSCPTHAVWRLLRVSLTYKPASSLRLGFCSGTPESWNISLVLHITRTQYNIFCEMAIVLTASQGCLFFRSTLTYWGTIMGLGDSAMDKTESLPTWCHALWRGIMLWGWLPPSFTWRQSCPQQGFSSYHLT